MGSRVAVVCVAIAACGRVGFAPERIAGDDIDANSGHHDAPPIDASRVLLETVTVPTDGSVVHSKTILAQGVDYELVASGTFIFAGSNELADAEYFSLAGSNGPQDLDTSNNLDFGMALDTPNIGLTKKPAHWGAYNAASTYSVPFPGNGDRLAITLFDCCYTDNIGTLTLQIFQ